ncbi:helix-turn-helix domain-containing protein [Myceligenerans salitolerans]|uniref:Helix-turn-helix domain-containing protein n=1 Tax=Myceligenerans salitolerans TaxID=1230528 RepID=A0ABS3I9K5_9MICO|nr:helix-turn-helix domain-containing protein [Myceligenerans salitolerans]MBO0609711.1 helix-turn-helix domain-containing protein [Myceligenerans salitolerans]
MDAVAAPARPHRVATLVTEGMAPFELSSVVEVFGLPRPEVEGSWYALDVCSDRPGVPLPMTGGFSLSAQHGLDVLAGADTVIVPAVVDPRSGPGDEVVQAIRSAHARGARVVSICSGAFALAAAGLLDGREATTHWRYAGLLAERFPAVSVRPDVLYVDHGDVLTSAGSAAGLDLCLHLVRTDHGPAVANTVARRLVVPPHREGGQAQFIESPVVPVEARDDVGEVLVWALDHLAEPITVDMLAERAHLAPRTFARHFTRRTGTSPMRWLITQRVQASLPLLEAGESVTRTAALVGFESPVTFRHHFTRAMGTSPAGYRRAFHG